MSLSGRPFLNDIMGGSFKIWSVVGSTSSLRFLSDLELLGVVLPRGRFFFLFCFLEEGLESFLEISSLRGCC